MKTSILISSLFILCGSVGLAGCGGPQSGQSGNMVAEVVKPAEQQPADQTGTGEASATGEAGEASGAAAPAMPELSATALGPQIGGGMVRFNYKPSPVPSKIYLAGSFNDWQPSNDDFVLTDDDGDGIYSITIKLPPGSYQYKFVHNGTDWKKDPYSPAAHNDGFGGMNGKFEVPPPAN